MNATDTRDLLRAAAQAGRSAYCPYSRFRVGAALRCCDGTVFTGCNVENASYGLTICAERAALFAAVAAGHRAFTVLAIVADAPHPPTPCGACRQVLSEFCDPQFPIVTATAADTEAFQTRLLGTLLPEAFSLSPVDASPPRPSGNAGDAHPH